MLKHKTSWKEICLQTAWLSRQLLTPFLLFHQRNWSQNRSSGEKIGRLRFTHLLPMAPMNAPTMPGAVNTKYIISSIGHIEWQQIEKLRSIKVNNGKGAIVIIPHRNGCFGLNNPKIIPLNARSVMVNHDISPIPLITAGHKGWSWSCWFMLVPGIKMGGSTIEIRPKIAEAM